MSGDANPDRLMSTTPASQDGGRSHPQLRMRRLLNSSPAYMGVILLILVIFFSLMTPGTFASAINARNILLDASMLLVVSVGMTYVMIGGGLDLSVGSVLVFAGVCAAQTMTAIGTDNVWTVIVGTLVALLAGLAWGLFNGLCIVKLRVPPLITTLGTMGAALGFAELLTNGNDVRGIPMTLMSLGTSNVAGVPWIVVIAAIVTVIGGVWLHLTRFGRHTYILGSNAEAARRAGINVVRHQFMLYAITGTLSGLAGMLSLARFATTTIEGHGTDNLQSITAVVLGGTSLFGGVGSIIGTVFGVFIPSVLQNGFVIMGVQPFWQAVVIGFVLIGAVYLDQIKRRNRDRG